MSDRPDRDPVAALRRLAAEPVDAGADRLDAIGGRIASLIDDDGDRAGAVVVPLAPRRNRTGTIALAAACLILVIAAGALLLRSDDDALVIAAADGVSVTLDDGTAVDGTEGLELPDGAVLSVEGFVIVDGDRFGPGDYRVDDGELQLVDDPTPRSGDDGTDPGAPEIAPPSTIAVDEDDDAGDGGADSDGVVPAEPGDTASVDAEPTTTAIDATSPTRPPQTDAPTTTVRGPDETRPPERTSVPTADSRPATTVAATTPATRPPTITSEPTRRTDETRPERTTTTTTTEPVRDR